MVLTSMITFTALYGVLAVIEVKLLLKYLRLGLPDVSPPDRDLRLRRGRPPRLQLLTTDEQGELPWN